MKKFCFFLIFCLFSLSLFSETVTTINIINALKTEYRKNEETGNETIFLDGNVELSVSKESVVTKIQADIISYDRVTKMLYADGNVHLVSTGSAAGDENVTADSLIMNTSTLEGVFDGGRVIQTKSDAINLPSGSTLVVFSDMFGKSESNILAFKNASMTFCDDDDPHWKINASRMWLLSGGEFAFLNAVLYVGKVPLIYLPAFYYPKDELIFNPAMGYKYRTGFYVNTTTYLYGRKPLNSSSISSSSTDTKEMDETLNSLYNFMKPSSLKKQEREGIVLHNLDEDFTGNTSKYVKFIADWYSNLGYFVGLDGNLTPDNKYISKFVFNADLGFTNTVFRNGKEFTGFSSEGIRYWDDSNFLSLKLPFRYKGNLEFSLSKPFRINFSLPVYSDPYFLNDFGTRTEDLNWISSIKEFVESDTVNDTDQTITEVSSFIWNISSSWAPILPQLLRPYVNSLSINSSSSLNISSVTTDKTYLTNLHNKEWAEVTPRRRFYYPSQVTPFNVNLNFSGTLLQFPKESRGTSTTDKPSLAMELSKPDYYKTPEELKAEQEKAERERLEKEQAENKTEGSEISENINPEEKEEIALNSQDVVSEEKTENFLEENFNYPSMQFSGDSFKNISGLTYKLSYNVNPTLNTQIAYASENLKSPDDFQWSKYKSEMYNFKTPVTLSSVMNYADSFLSLTNRLAYEPVWQGHPKIKTYTSEDSEEDRWGYDQSAAMSLKKTDYATQKQDITNTNSLSFKPFVFIPAFSETGISWDTSVKLFTREFLTDEYTKNPDEENYNSWWKNQWTEWDEDTVTTNNINMTLAASQLEKTFSQKLEFSAALPPLEDRYTVKTTFSFPHFSTSVGTGIYKPKTTTTTTTASNESEDKKQEWKKNPLTQNASFSWNLLNSNLSITESFNYILDDSNEDKGPSSFSTSINWLGVNLSYSMQKTNTYDFIADSVDENGNIVWGKGWVLKTDEDGKAKKSFVPYSLSASYSIPKKTFYTWKNRISFSPSVSSSIVTDLVRPTNSYLTFSPSITFKLNELFYITFSSTSRNSVIYRYFQSMLGNEGRIPGEDNVFVDLVNSFRFDNENLRKASGFKLKSLNMTLEHELHDWKFQLKTKIEPRLVTEGQKKYYDFSPYLTIGIVWSPMEAVKTQILDEYGEWKLD